MDARKLVGMTQGARKRAFMGELDQIAEHVVAANGSASDVNRLLRPRYEFWRIGQRIRPCPGKHGCVNCTRTCGACEDLTPDDTRCLQCGVIMTTEGPFCDGSGVIPAKARKVRR